MRTSLVLLAAAALAACRGSVPRRDVPREAAHAAVLGGARVLVDGVEAADGSVSVNLESEDSGEAYRLALTAGPATPLLVEPGTYRWSPVRSLLGFRRAYLEVSAGGRRWRAPFPEGMSAAAPLRLASGGIVSLGVVEARVGLGGDASSPAEPLARLDDGPEARRGLVQGAVRAMMDPSRPEAARESAISWSRALEEELMRVAAKP